MQQTGDNYASLANQVQKENESSERTVLTQAVYVVRGGKSWGASVMWQHRPEQGSKEKPFLLTSLGAGAEPPSRTAPLTAELHSQIFCFLPLLVFALSK